MIKRRRYISTSGTGSEGVVFVSMSIETLDSEEPGSHERRDFLAGLSRESFSYD